MDKWEEISIGDLCEISRGGSPRPIADFVQESGTPWVKISDARKNDRYIYSTKEFIKPEGESKSRVVFPGDFILSNSATPGLPRFMKIRACIHDGWLLLREFSKNVDKIFLHYLLKFEKKALLLKGNGSIFTNLKTDILRNHIVSLPPLPEQEAIAEVLSSIDDKIDLLHRQNETLEELAETLFRQWFVEEEYNSTIGDLIHIQNGYAFKSKDFSNVGLNKVIKIKNISGSIVDISNADRISESVADNVNVKFSIVGGDILFAMTGAEIGKMGIVERNSQDLWLNQRVGLFKEKYEGSKYLAYLCLKSDFGQDYIENTATGSAQPNISGKGIEKCPFPKLMKEQIEKYSNILIPNFEKIVSNLGNIKTLTHLRDTLLPKLMSGEVRVKMK